MFYLFRYSNEPTLIYITKNLMIHELHNKKLLKHTKNEFIQDQVSTKKKKKFNKLIEFD